MNSGLWGQIGGAAQPALEGPEVRKGMVAALGCHGSAGLRWWREAEAVGVDPQASVVGVECVGLPAVWCPPRGRWAQVKGRDAELREPRRDAGGRPWQWAATQASEQTTDNTFQLDHPSRRRLKTRKPVEDGLRHE